MQRALFSGNETKYSFASAPYCYHLENLSMQFGKMKALNSVQLTIHPGEILFITGPSGAGKTTLLNVLANDITPTSGKIVRPSKKFFVAQVFQDLKLIPSYTCEENLWASYDRSIYRDKNEFVAELEELCKVLGVWSFKDLVIEKANGGLKQKVAMIRALLTRPDIILADEPTSALDKQSATKMFEILNFYNTRKNTTIVWATHNKDLIKQFPGKMAHLDSGKLVYSGHACFI